MDHGRMPPDGVEDLKSFCRSNDRVCPLPKHWNEIWKSLPGRIEVSGVWQPPVPIVLGAWYHFSDSDKAIRLEEQIEWAGGHGALEALARALRALREDQWHHADGASRQR